MRIERALRKYYATRVKNINIPSVPVLSTESEKTEQKSIPRTDILLNVFVHALIVVMFVFAFYPGRQESRFSQVFGKCAKELSLNKTLNKGLSALSEYINKKAMKIFVFFRLGQLNIPYVEKNLK